MRKRGRGAESACPRKAARFLAADSSDPLKLNNLNMNDGCTARKMSDPLAARQGRTDGAEENRTPNGSARLCHQRWFEMPLSDQQRGAFWDAMASSAHAYARLGSALRAKLNKASGSVQMMSGYSDAQKADVVSSALAQLVGVHQLSALARPQRGGAPAGAECSSTSN
jgi:hypothetical protein